MTIDEVTRYINRSLGAPFVALELSKEDFIPFIQEEALDVFTQYVPDINRIILNTDKKENYVNKKIKNLFWVKDPDERQVLSVINVSMDFSAFLAMGYPIFMPFTSADNVSEYALSMANADIGLAYSKTDVTWHQERNLNQVWIYCSDSMSKVFSIEYTRTHDPDLSTIPHEYNQLFRDLCLGFVMKSIGEIRSKYGTLNTPISDISLDNSLRDRGESLIDKTKEELEKKALILTHIVIA